MITTNRFSPSTNNIYICVTKISNNAMAEKQNYRCKCLYDSGSGDVDLELSFALTDEEYDLAIDAVDGSHGHLTGEYPDEMVDAIFEAVEDAEYETIATDPDVSDGVDMEERFPGWEDMSTEERIDALKEDGHILYELFDPDWIWEGVYKIQYPEED